MLTRNFPLGNTKNDMVEEQFTVIVNRNTKPIQNTLPYLSVEDYSQSSKEYSDDELVRDMSVSYSTFRPTIMSPVMSPDNGPSDETEDSLQCSVLLGFTGAEDIVCSEKQSVNYLYRVQTEDIIEPNGKEQVKDKQVVEEAISPRSESSDREESHSPSLIQNGAITEMGFAQDEDAVFINNKSINILEQMKSTEFKSVLSLNLDDIDSNKPTPGL